MEDIENMSGSRVISGSTVTSAARESKLNGMSYDQRHLLWQMQESSAPRDKTCGDRVYNDASYHRVRPVDVETVPGSYIIKSEIRIPGRTAASRSGGGGAA